MSHLTIEMAMAPGAAIPQTRQQQQASARDPSAPLQLAAGINFQARPGDMLQGFLCINVPQGKELKIVTHKGIEFYFRGYEHTTITTYTQSRQGGRQRHTEVAGGDLFRILTPPIVQPNNQIKETVFGPGVTRFPFTFQVPLGAPHTLSVQLANEGTAEDDDRHCGARRYREHLATGEIAFEIRALAYVAGIFTSNLVAQTPIIVLPNFQAAPHPQGLVPVQGAAGITIPDYCCCDCFGFKPVGITVTVPRTALANGELLSGIEVTIQNDSAKPIQSVTLALQTLATIRIPDSWRLAEVQRPYSVQRAVLGADVPAFTKRTLTLGLPVANLTPDIRGACLSSTSLLLIRVKVAGNTEQVTLRIPIFPYAGGFVSSPVAAFIPLGEGQPLVPLGAQPHPMPMQPPPSYGEQQLQPQPFYSSQSPPQPYQSQPAQYPQAPLPGQADLASPSAAYPAQSSPSQPWVDPVKSSNGNTA